MEEPVRKLVSVDDFIDADLVLSRNTDDELQRIKWMLNKERSPSAHETEKDFFTPVYGDLVSLNSCRMIRDAVGKDLLDDIANDYLSLLSTSSAIYEKNGDYALGIFSSGWCRFMDQASRQLCNCEDNREALDCGKWLCHESCWNNASKSAMAEGKPVDIECEGGINIYAVPIKAGEEIVGVINFGHGDPPRDPVILNQLAEKYKVPVEELTILSGKYESRPPFIIGMAKRRLEVSARLIGEIVERKMAESSLRNSEALLFGLFYNMTSGAAIYQVINDGSRGSDYIIRYFNKKSLENESLSSEQVIGKSLVEIRPAIDDYGLIPVFKKVWETGEPAFYPAKIYVDEKFNNYYENYIFKIPTGEIVAIYNDVTERMQSQQALEELNSSLEKRVNERTADVLASNRELEAFTYTVSHDLRAPLRAMDGFSRMLLEDHAANLNQEGVRLLKVISDNAKEMGCLVDDLLAFSRINREEFRHTSIDMTLLAQNTWDELSTPEEKASIVFQIEQMPDAFGGITLIRQVWRNLISNAIKFTSLKENRIITIGSFMSDNDPVYFIRDNGVGFKQDYAPKLFGIFQRLHNKHEFEGTGVGLAVVFRIIQRHGGKVWAEARINEGATFYFKLGVCETGN
jgi:signal transduction histidine kinase